MQQSAGWKYIHKSKCYIRTAQKNTLTPLKMMSRMQVWVNHWNKLISKNQLDSLIFLVTPLSQSLIQWNHETALTLHRFIHHSHLHPNRSIKKKKTVLSGLSIIFINRWWNRFLQSSVDKQFKRKQRETYMSSWHETLVTSWCVLMCYTMPKDFQTAFWQLLGM